MTEPLRAAIEHLYRVFAGYPLNPNMDGSPMYHELPEWNRQLATKPLRELTADELSVFYFKVMTTWGGVDDFRHFLPRIFELLTDFRTYWEEWVALDKLNYGHWRTWPALEQAAVCAYLVAFWEEVLTTPDELMDAFCGEYFGAIANVYPDLSELLRRWEQAPLAGLIRLGSFVSRDFAYIQQKRQLSLFDHRDDLGPVVLAWLSTDAVLTRLEQAFFAAPDDYLAAEVSGAVQLLENYRRQLAR